MNVKPLFFQPVNFFKESVIPSLTTQQKKILVVALAAFACLAACLYYFLRVKTEAPLIEDKKQADEKKPADGKKEVDPILEEDILDPIDVKVDPVDVKAVPADLKTEVDIKPQVDLLAKSLLFPTSQPVQYSGFEFGGDDTKDPAIPPELMAQNADARQKIVEALGGDEACRSIPIVECPKLFPYLDCFRAYDHFPKGHAIVQGEDQAGRKFVLLRLIDKKTDEVFIERIFQRRRETCIAPSNRGQDGSAWVNETNDFRPAVWGADKIADSIKEILANTHPKYRLHPQD